jgi:hypothetical protein
MEARQAVTAVAFLLFAVLWFTGFLNYPLYRLGLWPVTQGNCVTLESDATIYCDGVWSMKPPPDGMSAEEAYWDDWGHDFKKALGF